MVICIVLLVLISLPCLPHMPWDDIKMRTQAWGAYALDTNIPDLAYEVYKHHYHPHMLAIRIHIMLHL